MIPHGYQPTARTYANVETRQIFRMYQHSDTKALKLINEQTHEDVSNFYICAFTDCEVKLNTGEIVSLQQGTFFQQTAERKVAARKFCSEKRFRKI